MARPSYLRRAATDDDSGSRPWRAASLGAARLAFVVAVAVLFIRVALRSADQLRNVSLHVRPPWLLASAPFTLAGGLLLPLAWARLLSAYGTSVSVVTAIRVWSMAQTSRFVPGSVAAAASRVVLAAREGVPRSLGAASFVVELGLLVGWSVVAAGALLPPSMLPSKIRFGLSTLALAGILSLPWLLRLGRLVASRLPALSPNALRPRRLYQSIALYGLNAGTKTLAFVLLAAALVPVRWGDVPLLAGAVNAAIVAGIIGVTPAGLGVREGILATLLQHRFGLGDAAAVAIALRAWELLAEVAWLTFVGLTRPAAHPRTPSVSVAGQVRRPNP